MASHSPHSLDFDGQKRKNRGGYQETLGAHSYQAASVTVQGRQLIQRLWGKLSIKSPQRQGLFLMAGPHVFFILLALLFSLPSRVTSGPVNIGKLSVHIYYEITRCWKPPAPALNIIWVLLDNLLLLSSTHKEKNAEARKAKCGVATRNSITSRNVHTIHCLWQLQRADWDDELLQECRPHFTFTLLSFWAAPLT